MQSKALARAGSVYTWGWLGGRLHMSPTLCDSLSGKAVIVAIACGEEHVVRIEPLRTPLAPRASVARPRVRPIVSRNEVEPRVCSCG